MNRPLKIWLLACLIPHLALAGDTVFRTVDDKGDLVFSDAPVEQGSLQRRSYKNFKGRETATASCTGANSTLLLERFAALEKFIEQGASQHSIDPLLVKAVARVESCFDISAVSRAGARGVMQLMPGTADYLGVTNVFNAEQNILGGTRYLTEMLDRFAGNHELALAAYNAGPGAVDRFNGVPPFPETQNYIKRVSQHYEQYKEQHKGMNRTSAREL